MRCVTLGTKAQRVEQTLAALAATRASRAALNLAFTESISSGFSTGPPLFCVQGVVEG